jgi:hypothetical protein
VATKKQRRRREKLRRHEWEYVQENDDGEEVVIESPRDADVAKAEKSEATQGPSDARGRPVQKPSFQRLGKRAAIFGPLLFVLVFITGGDSLSTNQKIFQAVLLLAVFMPLSYLLDHVMYRMLMRRHNRKLAARRDGG